MVKGSCVVFESTVYPGATEEVCVPILEQESGLKLGSDFTVGYSPERINPGDKVHTLENIVKIIAGSDKSAARLLSEVYGSIVKAGIHEVSSIKVAEAAKVIENTQRDLNIALMNELSMIFHKIGIDTLKEIGLQRIADLCKDGKQLVIDLKGSFSLSEAGELNITYLRL